MAATHHDFGAVQIRAESLGKPGQRTFRVLLESPAGSASVWLEKQQLAELALGIERLVALHEAKDASARLPAAEPGHLQIEFKAGRIGLHFDADSQALFMLFEALADSEEPAQNDFKIACWAPRQAALEFSEAALAVCAAGRPLCPLCHGPIDPEGHRCPKTNGHRVAALEEGSQQA
jgi:uncharacterized repeat protein (TIGR03847 family)